MIRLFIKRVFLFTLGLVLVIALLTLAAYIYGKQKSNLSISSPEKSILVLGNSHIACAIDDSILSNCINLGANGEAYLYTYTKARVLLEHNPGIRYLMIGYSNNMLRNSIQRWYEDPGFLQEHFPKYANWMQAEEISTLLNINSKALLQSGQQYLSFSLNALKSPLGFPVSYWGGSLLLNQELGDSSTTTAAKPARDTNSYDSGIHELNLDYLRKIVKLASDRGVKVIFIRTPYHRQYHIDNQKEFEQVYQTWFSQIPLLDYKDFPLKDSCFKDFDHLNAKGARLFSDSLKKELDKILR